MVALAAAVSVPAQANAAPAVDGEFDIPGGVATDNDIVQGPDGNMWVTTNDTDGVARITPAGVVTEFPLGNNSFGIAVGPDNNLWVSTAIGVTKVPPTDPNNPTAYSDVQLENGRGIVAGPDGRMWVAGTGELISFNPADPDNTEDVEPIAGLQPHGMSVGSDGLLWIADGSGRVISATATLTPTITPYDIQSGGAGAAQDVAAGPEGQVVYVNPGGSPQTVGRLLPGGAPQPIRTRGGGPVRRRLRPGRRLLDRARQPQRPAAPHARRSDDDARRLLADRRHAGPRKIATGPNNTLWVTLDDPNSVARVTGVESASPPPPGTEPTTEIDKTPKKKLKARDKRNGKKGRAKAKFKFSSATPGVSFDCSLRKQKGRSRSSRAASRPPSTS